MDDLTTKNCLTAEGADQVVGEAEQMDVLTTKNYLTAEGADQVIGEAEQMDVLYDPSQRGIRVA